MYYYGARYYDAKVSVFQSVDPETETYPSMSPFVYAANNPIAFVDVNGEGPGDPPGPGYYAASMNLRTVGFIVRHPIAAAGIGQVIHNSTNISTNSARFAINTGLPENAAREGSHVNAFRHGIWLATITKEFGQSIAKQVGNAHENNPFVDTSKRTFTGSGALSEADQTIDLLNNQIGQKIGLANPDASMKDLAMAVLKDFYDNGFYVAEESKDGTVNIVKTRLTDKQYRNAIKGLFSTNKDGFTPEQWTRREAEIQAKKEEQMWKNVAKD